MTLRDQLTRWLRAASRRERCTTALVALGVTALVGIALVPAPAERSDAAIEVDIPTAAGPPVASEAVTVSAPSMPAAAPAAAVAGSTPVAGGGGGEVADPANPAPTTAPPGALVATDRGVSADSIKVGFAIAGFAGATEAGIVTGVRTDVSDAIDALVAHANEQGGVLGRRIEAVKVSPDLAQSADQRQKCLELTETNKVFAVIDSFAFFYETSNACITSEHQTLLISGNPGSAENVRRGFPYQVSLQKDHNRKMKDLVAAARAAGFFDPEKGFTRLGIFDEACFPSMYDGPEDGLEHYLSEAGITAWTEFRVGCADVAGAQRGGAEAVLRFQQDDVSHVLLIARPPFIEGYLDAAGRARYYPEYFTGDYFNLVLGALSDDYEPEGFDGALAVTSTHAGEGTAGKPLPPLAERCSKIFTDHGVAPVVAEPPDDIADDIEVLELCESFLLFLQVATAAGPTLTRATWVEALATVGDVRGATVDLARFDRPGKVTGGDTMKLARWHRSCRCWKEASAFGPAAG
jgi:hypothetical protein